MKESSVERFRRGLCSASEDGRGAAFGPIDPRGEVPRPVFSRPVVSTLLVLPATMCLPARRRASSGQRIRTQSQSRRQFIQVHHRHDPGTPLLRRQPPRKRRGDAAAVAKAGKGDYPEGSILQLMPNEVMIKQQKGFNPETHDWEFFFIDVDKNGSKIFTRGFAEVNNRLGSNCFACHSQAKPEFDLVCEQDHGMRPIPVTRAMFARAAERTDPRCRVRSR